MKKNVLWAAMCCLSFALLPAAMGQQPSVYFVPEGAYSRTFDWSVNTQCLGSSDLKLAPGQTYRYPSQWTLAADFTDSNWRSEGFISVQNLTAASMTITSIEVTLRPGDSIAILTCTPSLPITLLPGGILECTYLAPLPDASPRTAELTVSGSFGVMSRVENVVFGFPWENQDECVITSDNCTQSREACFNGIEYAWVFRIGDDQVLYVNIPGGQPPVNNYVCPIRYDVCGSNNYINTASVEESDTHEIVTDQCAVSVNVPCNICTLTPGYWKSHSELGPAPYDDAWAGLPNGASTTFFLSGTTYYGVLVSPNTGIYWPLASQYAAAKLNQLNGATMPPNVLGAFNATTNMLQNNTPAQMNSWTGIRRFLVLSLTGIMRNYNMGLTGPGSCDEDSSSAQNRSNIEESQPISVEAGWYYLIPNPASGEVWLYGAADARVTVLDLSGRICRITQAKGDTRLDLSGVSPGLYLVQIQEGDNVKTLKLIVR